MKQTVLSLAFTQSSKRTALLFLFGCHLSVVWAFEGQLRLSPYVDTNVTESLTGAETSFGVKLRGAASHQLRREKWSLYSDAVAQTFLDPLYTAESKFVARPEVGLTYRFSARTKLTGRVSHFHKAFFWQKRSYQWTETSTHLTVSPSARASASIGYSTKWTRFQTYTNIRFRDDNLELRGSVNFSPRTSIEWFASGGKIHYTDYRAWTLRDNVFLLLSEKDQRDETIMASLHMRHQGRVIIGTQLGVESVTSNSVISEYNLMSFRAYVSGRLGKSSFYHLVLQRVDKNYAFTLQGGLSAYRDPEEAVQNRTYLQLEHVEASGRTLFIQLSLLENETILNRQYYDKTMVEAGVKFDL